MRGFRTTFGESCFRGEKVELMKSRLAYQLAETSGDFTKAATAFLSNGTWIDAAPGPG